MRKVNRIYRKIANQRLDSLHKKSTEIANQYDIVCVEDLDMKAIGNKGFGNGKSDLLTTVMECFLICLSTSLKKEVNIL